MNSPARAIAWDLFARNRWAVLFAFGLIPFCAAVSIVFPAAHEFISIMHVLGAILSFTALLWVASYTDHDTRGVFFGFPSWMYPLPMRTRRLVLLPMAMGAVLMLAAVLLWELAIRAHWRLPFQPLHLAWHAALSLAALAAAQAIIWSLYCFRWIRFTALILMFAGLTYFGLAAHTWNFAAGSGWWLGGAMLVALLSAAAAIAGVARDRHGEWQGWTTRLLEWLLDRIPRRRGPFRSARGAQLWLEWRRRGLFLALIFVVPVLNLLLLPIVTYAEPQAAHLIFSGMFLALIFLCGCIGASLAKSDAWVRDLSVHPFAAARPQADSDIVFAKMKAAAFVALLGGCGFAVLLGVVVAFELGTGWSDGPPRAFWRDFGSIFPGFHGWISHPVVVAALFAVTWHMIVRSMVAVLTGDRRRILISTWMTVIVTTLIAAGAMWLHKDRSRVDELLPLLPWVTGAILLMKLALAFRAFQAVRPLVSSGAFSALLLLWAAVAVLVIAAGWIGQMTGGLPQAVIWFLAVWIFLPGGEGPACIAALHHNRHR